jgi:hypothetical protein
MSLRIVVLGTVARVPFAGVAWQALQYLEGLRALGHDVHYVEDTGDWPYDPVEHAVTDDPTRAIAYLEGVMRFGGFADRWAYASAARPGEAFGPAGSDVSSLLRSADVLVNLCAATLLRDEHLAIPARVYLETDPVTPQIQLANGSRSTAELMDAHTHHFSYGENFGAADCSVPLDGYAYRPTRQPIVLDWWRTSAPPGRRCFTTVANWRQESKEVEWNGERYSWSKHHEFLKVIRLPRVAGHSFELALACGDETAKRDLRSNGWGVVDAMTLTGDLSRYRAYIHDSRGEFTVAKDQNVRLRSGWFSDRSAAYLAAGRPVVTQDTAFGNVLPTGEGLLAFGTLEEAAWAVAEIEADYERHARAAYEIAREHFAADRVLGRMLDELGA